MDFFTFYATTGAEKCNHQLVVATTGAFTLTSVLYMVRVLLRECCHFLSCAANRNYPGKFRGIAWNQTSDEHRGSFLIT